MNPNEIPFQSPVGSLDRPFPPRMKLEDTPLMPLLKECFGVATFRPLQEEICATPLREMQQPDWSKSNWK